MPAPLLIPVALTVGQQYAARIAAIETVAGVGRVIQAASRFVQAPAVPVLRTAVQAVPRVVTRAATRTATRAAPVAPLFAPNPFQRIEPTTLIRSGRVGIERAISEGRAVDPFAPGVPRIGTALSESPFGRPFELGDRQVRIVPRGINPLTGRPGTFPSSKASRAAERARRLSLNPTPSPKTAPRPNLDPVPPIFTPTPPFFAPSPAPRTTPSTRGDGGQTIGRIDLSRALNPRTQAQPQTEPARRCREICTDPNKPRRKPQRRCARWVSI